MTTTMRPIFIVSCILILLGIGSPISAQTQYPQDYFRSPLDIPIKLAGNFGEIRPNHFHGGLDMKTESVEGKNIYAAAEGYVSRIKVSPWGYGKTLYITHPNGYITVYAHLKRYSDKIEEYVKEYQYSKKSYPVEKFPLSTELRIEKGEVIALGGNTGGSSGPHLHFEIRDAITGYVVNPLLFGFPIMDSIKPVVRSVRIYPLGAESHVANLSTPRYLAIKGSSGNYRISSSNPIKVQGDVGFSVEVYDFLNYSHNKCGIFSIELQKDGERVYYHEMETYGFHENRYISSHVDYKEFKDKGKHLQKSFIAPNNRLGIYKETLNRGVISINDLKLHEVRYIIKDSYGNTSIVNIPVQGQLSAGTNDMVSKVTPVAEESVLVPADTGLVNKQGKNSGGSESNTPAGLKLLPKLPEETLSVNFVKKFHYQFSNSFDNNDVRVYLDEGLLYEDVNFEYQVTDTMTGAIAPTHHIHNNYTPVHKRYSIAIRTDQLPDRFKSKVMIARVKKNGRTYYEGGAYQGDFIKTTSKYFGTFTVLVDTIAPRVRGLNIYNGKNMSGARNITVSIYDKLSGIDTYHAYIDDNWILMEYEPKKSALVFSFDDMGKYASDLKSDGMGKSSHTFKVVVTDNRGNTTEKSFEFIR